MKPEKQLYQWDVNQYLTDINPAAKYVDYQMGNEVIRIETDGTRCRIPDEVLQTYGGKTCYERYPDGTFRAYSFSVLYAPKPPDYVYTPEERTTFESLTARVDAAIEEIKRRADSGEFDGKTPVKGVDYYTKEEQAELITAVSSGAESEFRKVTEAETAKFEATAAEKLEAYNSNHAAKVAEYNQNAKTKTAEFDANAAALQTEVDRLRGECDNLAAENRKQENKISALMKLNKGQTYDILPEEGESASRTAPSGAKYVSVDKVGGKSIVWSQLWNYGETIKENGVTFTYENYFYDVVQNTTAHNGILVYYNIKASNKYYVSFEASSSDNISLSLSLGPALIAKLTENNKRYSTIITTYASMPVPRVAIYLYSSDGVTCSYRVGNIKAIDLTAMFGVGNEPTAEQFERMFPAEFYPYNPGEIISSRTETITAGAESITTGFPVLHSAGAAHDEIDMDGGEIRRSVGVVDLGTLDWTYNSEYKFMTVAVDGKRAGHKNLIISRYNLSPNEVWQQDTDGVYGGNEQNNIIYVKDLNYSDPAAFKVAIRGVMLHYERATPTTEPVTIPEPLQEWLPVEAGGTVKFQNADESKQLPVPNAVSWVRKLNEVN